MRKKRNRNFTIVAVYDETNDDGSIGSWVECVKAPDADCAAMHAPFGSAVIAVFAGNHTDLFDPTPKEAE